MSAMGDVAGETEGDFEQAYRIADSKGMLNAE